MEQHSLELTFMVMLVDLLALPCSQATMGATFCWMGDRLLDFMGDPIITIVGDEPIPKILEVDTTWPEQTPYDFRVGQCV